MGLIAITNSVGFHSYIEETPGFYTDRGVSYLNLLGNPPGLYKDGITILNAVRALPVFLTGLSNTVIINLGVVECYTHENKNFMTSASNFLGIYGPCHLFETFVLPKLFFASRDLVHNIKSYYSYLSLLEFEYIWRNFLSRILQGSKVILVGMGKPEGNQAYWVDQAQAVNQLYSILSAKYGYEFVDIWDVTATQIIDGCHLTEEGHRIVYEKIKGKL